MNIDQIFSILRFLMTALGSAIVSKGYADTSTWEAIVGGTLGVVSVGWSIYHHTDTNQVKRASAILNPHAQALPPTPPTQ